MTVCLSDAPREFVTTKAGWDGAYENAREHIRVLIRCNQDRTERAAFDRLKAELNRAFAAPEESYKPPMAAEVTARNRP